MKNKRQKYILYDMKTGTLAAVFTLWLAGSMLLAAQDVHADPQSFRNKYQLGKNDLLVSLPDISR
jgi:hypothetical protein